MIVITHTKKKYTYNHFQLLIKIENFINIIKKVNALQFIIVLERLVVI